MTYIPSRRGFVSAMLGAAGAPVFNVREQGAVADGSALCTKALQKAIDSCAEAGGGTVYFPAGRYLSGTLYLKSRVSLYLEAGATLAGSRSLSDYPKTVPALRSYTDNYTETSLLYGENLEDIAIHGRGSLDGQGAAFEGPYKVRPYMVRIIGCRNVSVKDITLRDSPMWVQHYLACENVNIHGITVHSRVNHNNDGIDIDCCDRVRISDCEIVSGDDAIVLKSTSDRPCRDVTVTNCVLSSLCNALKLGTESNGGFRNIAIGNCTIYDTRLSGIALEMVDGGILDGVNVSNIVMRNVRNPIFVRLGNRARPFKDGMAAPGMGSLRNIVIADVQADGADRTGCSVTGVPGHPVENVLVENVRIAFEGGGTAEDARKSVPDNPEKYPEYKMFGTLPAYGFSCRHAKNVTFSRVETVLQAPDARPALFFDDVDGLKLLDSGAATRLKDARRVFVSGCRAPSGTFLRVEGAASEAIRLVGNDLTAAAQPVETAPEVRKEAVALAGNLP